MLQTRRYLVKKVSSWSPWLECSYRRISIVVTKQRFRKLAQSSHKNTSPFFTKKEWQGEILKTEPAQLTRVIWKRPSMWLDFTNKHSFQWLSVLKTKKVTNSWWSYRPTQLHVKSFLAATVYNMCCSYNTFTIISTESNWRLTCSR